MKLPFSGRFQGYNGKKFQKDLISGLIVGIVAIPLGMAFAIASGVKPEYGLYTTFVAGILISLLGGSKFQIGGPTGAFIPILFAIVMQYGYENLLIAGFMAGIILLFMGIFKLGGVIKFIPRPVTIGFTTGIAVTIFTGQIANFLGLHNLEKHQEFFANMKELVLHISTINKYSILTAVICLVLIILTPKLFPKIPGSLVGILISTVAASLFYPDKIATIGSTYGAIPNSLPSVHVPALSIAHIQTLIKPAFVIAMLGGIESLLSAVVADGMSGSRHNSNRELIGQGIANMITPLFGGIPATGAIARTATNIKSGAESPFSGVIHGIVVLLVLFLFAPYASNIPLASMAPILMVVAWNMSERKEFAHVLKTKTAESFVLLITFLLTVLTDLTTAVEVGLVLSGIIFVKHMSSLLVTAKVLPDPANKNEKVAAHMVNEQHNCPQISIYTVEGALFFGVANMFEKSIMDEIHYKPKVLLLKMDNVPYLDTTGESNLSSIVKHFNKHGGSVIISELQNQPRQMLKKTRLDEFIGQDHLFEKTGDAVSFALTKLNLHQCLGCKHFAFRECRQLSNPSV
ncbi:C4-dicarboxylic acid transporter DauA [Paenibacillus allorhizoplanae]|uniref:C4-dicarboxylic acid transporter DauA n=1 Tax=Paenibacillus allorhizoplanae TaxID=2905648 RepID=A0ABN8GA86_9BACL|nr:sulfate permease [Paenibacillus allorhizoplanae]CAH1202216.1 C4-dicarboxylic acid transporter DauA [Paenibacillus allorhizoplanae]